MRELNELLKYMDYYIYDSTDGGTVIKDKRGFEDAKKCYENAVAMQDAYFDGKEGYNKNMERWILNIAIDCVRSLDDDLKKYISGHMNYMEYHMGYGMGIRNRYINQSSTFQSGYSAGYRYLLADDISGAVMKRMFSILSPFYDFRNEASVYYYSDRAYQCISEKYKEKYPQCFIEVEESFLNPEFKGTKADVLQALRDRVIKQVGEEEFISNLRQFKVDMDREIEENDDWDTLGNIEDKYWNDKLEAYAPLFPREVNQAKSLHAIRFISKIERNRLDGIYSVDECKQFIDRELGLKDEYAAFMAKAFWDVWEKPHEKDRKAEDES
ncbi:MAG: hypothetical protein K6G81_11880 [Lachnospiraceae bacterium]|nr:hypothetical protein [Lachnospiraceae bacterium]